MLNHNFWHNGNHCDFLCDTKDTFWYHYYEKYKNDQKNQLHFIEHFYVMTHAKIIQTTSFGVSKSSPFVL